MKFLVEFEVLVSVGGRRPGRVIYEIHRIA